KRYLAFTASEGWEKYRKGRLGRLLGRFRRTVGLQTNSIHVYTGQEYVDLLPSFLAVLAGMAIVFAGGLKILWETAFTANGMIAIALSLSSILAGCWAT